MQENKNIGSLNTTMNGFNMSNPEVMNKT